MVLYRWVSSSYDVVYDVVFDIIKQFLLVWAPSKLRFFHPILADKLFIGPSGKLYIYFF